MAVLGFTPLTEAAALAPTLSVLALPPGVDDAELRAGMAARGVLVAGCLGALAGRGIRIGHLGNYDRFDIIRCLAALEMTLEEMGYPVKRGSAVAAAEEVFRRSPAKAPPV